MNGSFPEEMQTPAEAIGQHRGEDTCPGNRAVPFEAEAAEASVDDALRLVVPAEHEGVRLDQFLAQTCPELSRSFLQGLIRDSLVLRNGALCKAKDRVRAEDELIVTVPPPREAEILPENIPLDILYEDGDVLIVNKPKGMVVHPAAGHYSGTLVNAIMYHCGASLSGINGVIRPGIVHRIDMDTTGTLIVCKNDESHVRIAEQIRQHSVHRIYEGIAVGSLKLECGETATIESTIGRSPKDRKKMAVNVRGGKPAVTHYRVLEHLNGYDYLRFALETGRTHQIRVHMSSIGHPLLGDTLYAGRKAPVKGLQGQCLHAKTIGFVHPRTGEYMEFSAPLPEYFVRLLEKLRQV